MASAKHAVCFIAVAAFVVTATAALAAVAAFAATTTMSHVAAATATAVQCVRSRCHR